MHVESAADGLVLSPAIAGERAEQAKKRTPTRPRKREREDLYLYRRILRAIARRDVLFLRVLRRRFLDHPAHQLAVRGDPVGDHLPLGAVSLQELHGAAAFMVHARD